MGKWQGFESVAARVISSEAETSLLPFFFLKCLALSLLAPALTYCKYLPRLLTHFFRALFYFLTAHILFSK